ncbi:AGE family epimerase/isomerase [Pseudactinotalea sp. Z1732]|uniref:AGE family epimerase/isomerase n=1 Tax=Micrococcales TaxID=85006 RepID=UPI003C7C3CE2
MTTPIAGLSQEMLTEAAHLLDFGTGARLPHGGFGWLDTTGVPMPGRPRMLYVTCRMTHTYALGALAGHRGATEMVRHGIAALNDVFRDADHGGWFTAVDETTSEPVQSTKWAYPHSFVVLAAASATLAGVRGGRELLEEALGVLTERFWDEAQGALVEEWDRTFTTLSPYRGANSAMHGVEALLAAADATGDGRWAQMAHRISERMIAAARDHEWRLPEHYDEHWRPDLEHNADQREDPFKPYGATPGHSFEWARLLVHLGQGDADLTAAAERLFHRAVTDAWAVDGEQGFVYTVDWQGEPIVRNRLHWVLCEALAAASVLGQTTQLLEYPTWLQRWWRYAREHHIDTVGGSWHHELGPDLTPSTRIRPGKADIYHAVQACLLPVLLPARSLAGALTATTVHLPEPPARGRQHARGATNGPQ